MSKTKVTAKVVTQVKLCDGIYDMWIEAPGIASEAKPGQFISVYTYDSSKLLPRPISICQIDADGGKLRIVYRVTGGGTGTEEFSKYGAGHDIDILGPLGHGFDMSIDSNKDVIVIGGGIGIPPMLEVCKQLQSEVIAVMGYRDKETFLSDEFKMEADQLYIATEDGSIGTKGNVLDAIRQYHVGGDIIMACGPTPMLRAIKAYAKEQKIKCYISLEERMACGVGACLGCVCKSKDIDEHSHVFNKRICKDGPVFDAEEVEI